MHNQTVFNICEHNGWKYIFTLKNSNLKSLWEEIRFLISNAGRMRWKIENWGFNEQKNTAYNLRHKYSRTLFNASQNYYQCLQMAHMIIQLAYKAQAITEMLEGKDTLKILRRVSYCTDSHFKFR